jgi:hypothetical protein
MPVEVQSHDEPATDFGFRVVGNGVSRFVEDKLGGFSPGFAIVVRLNVRLPRDKLGGVSDL